MTKVISTVELRSGAIVFARFVNMPQRAYDTLVSEFGSYAVFDSRSNATPLASIRFASVTPPHSAIFVGRTACVANGALWIREGKAWASVPLREILDDGADFTITCDPGVDIIRFVGYTAEPIIKIRALLFDLVFLHSSSIGLSDDTAIILSAWGNTGKTNLMLKMHESGFPIVADDWTVISVDGRVFSYPRPVNLMNYNLDAFPSLHSFLPYKKRLIYQLDRFFRNRVRPRMPGSGIGLRVADLAGRLLELAANTRVPLQAFSSINADGYALGGIIELHKTGVIDVTAHHVAGTAYVAAMAECFAYELTRFFHRLSEYVYVHPEADSLRDNILTLYKKTFLRVLKNFSQDDVLSIGLPPNAGQACLAQASEVARSNCSRA